MGSHRVKNLSKLMSYILSHRPDEFGLVLDGDGFIPLKELHKAIIEEEGWSNVRKRDIQEVLFSGDREKFEVEGKLIRATKNHSIPEKITYEPCVPPKTLYHGTRRKAYPSILRHGLRPMKGQYVYLTISEALAHRIGRRRDPNPVMLVIHAKKAHQEGIVFYGTYELIFLVEDLPVEYFTGPPLPMERAQKVQKKEEKDVEVNVPEDVLFARGLHPHKDWKGKKTKGTSWKNETRKYRRQQNR